MARRGTAQWSGTRRASSPPGHGGTVVGSHDFPAVDKPSRLHHAPSGGITWIAAGPPAISSAGTVSSIVANCTPWREATASR